MERCGTVCGRSWEVREEGGRMEVVGCGEGVWEWGLMWVGRWVGGKCSAVGRLWVSG